MELCLTPYWSEVKDVTLSLNLTFHSIQPSPTTLVFVRCACNAMTYVHLITAVALVLSHMTLNL